MKKMNNSELTKEEYVKMLNERLGYLKDEIEFFAKYGGPTEENRLWDIKEQLSCMIGLVNQCDIDLFPDTIHLKNKYEWLKSLNMEQLAEFLNLIIRVGPYENEPKDFWEHVYGRGGEHGVKSIIMWLKQPHREDKHNEIDDR